MYTVVYSRPRLGATGATRRGGDMPDVLEFSSEELTVEFPLDDAAPSAEPSDGGGS